MGEFKKMRESIYLLRNTSLFPQSFAGSSTFTCRISSNPHHAPLTHVTDEKTEVWDIKHLAQLVRVAEPGPQVPSSKTKILSWPQSYFPWCLTLKVENRNEYVIGWAVSSPPLQISMVKVSSRTSERDCIWRQGLERLCGYVETRL